MVLLVKHSAKQSWVLAMVLLTASVLFTFTVQAEHSVVPVVTCDVATTLKQGGLAVVKVQSPQPLPKDSKLVFNHKALPLFLNAEGHYQTLISTSVDTPAGNYPLKLQTGNPALDNSVSLPTVKVVSTWFRKQNISVSKKTGGLQPIAGELEAIQTLKQTITPTQYWHVGFISPTPDCENSPFGVKRYHNGKYIQDYHKGVDLRSPQGRPIRAITGGVVQIATTQYRLHGGTVGLDHGQGLTSVYIHMSKVAVKPGEKVEKGQIIGYVGSTGFATGPHLHWGLFAMGTPVNPDLWIPVPHCG